MKKHLLTLGLCSVLMTPAVQAENVDQALVIVNSGSLQTQGMAMVLANAMQAKGTQVDVLLCDQAGYLALKSTQSSELKPRNVTPEQLMGKLQQGGAQVSVCALYLPNSQHTRNDLRKGINVAKPPAIADQMLDSNRRIYSF